MSFSLFRRKPIRVSVFGKTDVGRVRGHNEDRFLVADLTRRLPTLTPEVTDHVVGPMGSLLLVADGMGGAVAGEVASEMTAEAVYSHLLESTERPPKAQRFAADLRASLEAANARIHAYAAAHPEYAGMGSTATVAGILGADVYVAQVGDSRAYLVRQGVAAQLTEDQSLTRHLIETGRMTEAEAATAEGQNIILQALGPSPTVNVALTRQALCAGDILVLCSDGLSGMVDTPEIAQVVASSDDPSIHCEDLVALANSRGGRDNITVVVARLGGPGLKGPREGGSKVDPQPVP